MKYKITSGPTSHDGETVYVNGVLALGDIVEIRSADADGQGDVVVVDEHGDFRAYVALDCLTAFDPADVVQLSAVRAALVALGIEADVVAVAQAIEAAAKGA